MVILFLGFLLILIHMSIVWVIAEYFKNPAIVDLGWASGLTILGLFYLNVHFISIRFFLLSFMLVLWGLRLGFYLWFTRLRLNLKDKRYESISEFWISAKSIKFFLHFQFQGFLIFIIALPWYLIKDDPINEISIVDFLEFLLFFLFLFAESLADFQLVSFKKSHPGKLCDQGLWFYSRHPNYFFEWLIWLFFAVLALLSSSAGYLALISPVVLLWVMLKLTIPITEAGLLRSKGKDYLNYQQSTPMFFPIKNFWKF